MDRQGDRMPDELIDKIINDLKQIPAQVTQKRRGAALFGHRRAHADAWRPDTSVAAGDLPAQVELARLRRSP
jgi:hypothetical protein